MKYRIKKEIDGYSLTTTYIPQYLFMGLFWRRFVEYNYRCNYYIEYSSEQEARKYIDMKRAGKCTSSSYIDY